MAQLLTCPNKHHWDLTDDPFAVLLLTRGLCPQCGEPPTADSPVDWDREHWRALLLIPVMLIVFTLLLVPGVILVARRNPIVGCWPCCSFLAALIASAVVTEWVAQRRRQGQVKLAARALGFTFAPTVSRARAAALGLPSFLRTPWGLVDWRHCVEGTYQGSRVVVLDGVFKVPPAGTITPQTVVHFPEAVPGLPDFQIGPGSDERKFWNRTLEQHLLLRPLSPFRDEPFGRLYRLGRGDPAAVRPWLSPPLCAFLERQPGWVLGAWEGRFYLYRPQHRCRADACATFIAVGWRLREMLELPTP